MAYDDDGAKRNAPAEHEIIARHFRPLADRFPGARALLDDAAAFEPPAGEDLVVTCDALVAGVHFFPDDSAADIAFKALAVNVSDLAAKAACPLAYSLALVLPRSVEEDWIADFASGLDEAQQAFSIAMSGGDTTTSPSGPLVVSVTAFGTVPSGTMVPRNGGKDGDTLFVSGTIGDAALGLQLRLRGAGAENWPLSGDDRRFLLNRYLRPQPKPAMRGAIRSHAHAAMDISDGLAIDASRLCTASGLSARIDVSAVPLSTAAHRAIDAHPALIETALTGGDDYEILAAVPPAAEESFISDCNANGVSVTRIGRLTAGDGPPRFTGSGGADLAIKSPGYDHFRRPE